MALLPWSVRNGQNESKRTATTGAVHLSWPVNYKLLFPHQASTQGFLVTPTLKALAPTGSNPGQACCYQECSPHTLLPQRGLQYRPFLGVLYDQDATREILPHKDKGIPRIDVSKMSQPDLMEQFPQTFEKEFGSLQPGDSATEKWEALRDTMYCTALATFGKRSSTLYDWFEAKSTVMTPVIESKRAALAEYKRTPSERNLQILRISKSNVQQTARCCANESWTKVSENIQSAAITGNIRGMYDGIKKAIGPTLNKTALLRSSTGEVITDKGHQLER